MQWASTVTPPNPPLSESSGATIARETADLSDRVTG
ncbi:MAG: hypothetical protein RL320_619, partial [Pseudomonadota bacterium]